ncbi:oligosaccharide flippase family protein [Aeromonas veronii]
MTKSFLPGQLNGFSFTFLLMLSPRELKWLIENGNLANSEVCKLILFNALKLVFVQVTNYIFPLVLLPYLVTTLESDSFSKLVVCQAIVQYFVILVTYGFNFTATRRVSENRDKKSEVDKIFCNTVNARFVLTGLSFIAVVVYAGVWGGQLTTLLYICFLRVVAEAVNPSFLFQGIERMNILVSSSVLAKTVIFILTLYLVDGPDDLNCAAILQVMNFLIPSLLCLLFLFKSRIVRSYCFSTNGIIESLKDGCYVFISSFISSIYTNSTVIILAALTSPTVVSNYAAADKLRLAVQNLLIPISQAIFPRVTLLISKSTSLKKIIKNYGLYFIVVGLSLSFGILIFGRDFAQLYFGEDFILASEIFMSMFLLPSIIAPSLVLGYWWIIPKGHSNKLVFCYLFAAISFAIITYPLVVLFGVYGMVISVTVTELIVLIGMLFVCFRLKTSEGT